MVAAGELEDPVAAGRGPGEAEGGHRGLGARRDEPDLLDRRDGVGDLGGELDLGLGRGAEAGTELRGRGDRLDGLRVGVAEEQRAPRHHPVDVAVAVDVLEVGALAAAGEERLVEPDRAHRAHGRVDAAGDQILSPAPQRRGHSHWARSFVQ